LHLKLWKQPLEAYSGKEIRVCRRVENLPRWTNLDAPATAQFAPLASNPVAGIRFPSPPRRQPQAHFRAGIRLAQRSQMPT